MKFFLQSKTIIGILIPVLVQVLPMIGVSFSADDAALFGNLIDRIIELAGVALAVYGRFVAKDELSVTPVTKP